MRIAFDLPLDGVTLLTPNSRRRMHWRAQAKIAADQRRLAHLAGLMARRSDPNTTIKRAVHFTLVRGKGQRMLDPDALPSACKHFLDGMVDANLLRGDGAQWCVPSWSQERGPRPLLRVQVEDVTP